MFHGLVLIDYPPKQFLVEPDWLIKWFQLDNWLIDNY